MPDVSLNSLNWGTAVLDLSKLIFGSCRAAHTSVEACSQIWGGSCLSIKTAFETVCNSHKRAIWLLRVSGVSPTYNPSAGTGTDGRCGVRTRNTYTLLVRKIEACLFHQDTTSSTIFPCLKFSKKVPWQQWHYDLRVPDCLQLSRSRALPWRILSHSSRMSASRLRNVKDLAIDWQAK